MGAPPPIREFLIHTRNLSADAALLAALPTAGEDHQEWILDTLLKRGTSEGLGGLVRCYHQLGHNSQRVAVTRIDQLFATLRLSIKADDLKTRLNTIEMIAQSGNHRLGYLLGVALRDPERHARAAAAQALRGVASRFCTLAEALRATLARQVGSGPAAMIAQQQELVRLAEDRRLLAATLEQAVESFDTHQHTEVLEAAMWFADALGPAFWYRAGRPFGKCSRAMQEIFRRSSSPRLVAFAYQALRRAELRSVIARGVAPRRDKEFMAEMIRQSWAIADPAVQKGLGWIKQLAWLDAIRESVHELPDEVSSRAARFVTALSVPIDKKITFLRHLLSKGSRAAQEASLWALIEIRSDSATELLRAVAGRDDPQLSRIAGRELMRRGLAELSPATEGEISTPLLSAREIPGQPPQPWTFQAYWDAFPDMDDNAQVSAGREMIKLVPEAPQHLTRKMRAGKRSERIRALQIARTLGLSKGLDEQVYLLAHDPDRFVRSAAIASLAELPGPTTRRILRAALLDSDPRVQANAIEALDKLHDIAEVRRVASKVSDRNQRIRANTIKALLRLGLHEAARALLAMLSDSDRAQRVSALWVIERLNLRALIYRVVQMASNDPDPQVRRRATRLLAASRANAVSKPAREGESAGVRA